MKKYTLKRRIIRAGKADEENAPDISNAGSQDPGKEEVDEKAEVVVQSNRV